MLVICFIVFWLTGCESSENRIDIGKDSNIEITQKIVSLNIKENILTKTRAILVIKNNSDMDVLYGNNYEIEIKKEGEWKKINVELFFPLPAFLLKSKASKEIEFNWENGYGKLPLGNYRIIKNIALEKEAGTFDNFYISAEFTIE